MQILQIIAAFVVVLLTLILVFVFYASIFAVLFYAQLLSFIYLGKTIAVCLWIFLLSCLLGYMIFFSKDCIKLRARVKNWWNA
jgi:hypothetical protein